MSSLAKIHHDFLNGTKRRERQSTSVETGFTITEQRQELGHLPDKFYSYQNFLGMEQMRCLLEQIACRVQLNKGRWCQTHPRAPRHDRSKDNLKAFEARGEVRTRVTNRHRGIRKTRKTKPVQSDMKNIK